jgi:glycosyltransferase involved in cell wall biosynthesis
MKTNENLEKLKESLFRLKNNESYVYFLVYDTKGNPRASVKHIYDIASTLKNSGTKVKLLVEDKTYQGVSSWLGNRYEGIEIDSIKDTKIELKVDDILVVPEYYSGSLEQLATMKSVKVMLIQQKDYLFETLPIGSKWSDYGFLTAITTTNESKKYIMQYFPESLVYIIPPIIEDIFTIGDYPQKPLIAISCRDRGIHRKIISEFYLKYPELRWITFKDMIQMTYDEFADKLKECAVSVWIDEESTFGTFPLESMKCGVPVVGKIPHTEPDWIGENGLWSYDLDKIVEILGEYLLSWVEGIELSDEVLDNIRSTYSPYSKSLIENNIISIFSSLKNKRIESLESIITKNEEN